MTARLPRYVLVMRGAYDNWFRPPDSLHATLASAIVCGRRKKTTYAVFDEKGRIAFQGGLDEVG